jgi:hypothetical protein
LSCGSRCCAILLSAGLTLYIRSRFYKMNSNYSRPTVRRKFRIGNNPPTSLANGALGVGGRVDDTRRAIYRLTRR